MSLTTVVPLPLWLLLVVLAGLIAGLACLVTELLHIRQMASDHFRLQEQRRADWEQTIRELGERERSLSRREERIAFREQELGVPSPERYQKDEEAR